MNREQIQQFYEQQTEGLSAEIARLKKRNTAFVVGELISFALVIAALALYVSTQTGSVFLLVSLLMLVAYVLIRRSDVANSERTARLTCRRSVYEKELAYLAGDFSKFPDGQQYADTQHPYTFDLDIFGRDSLFNRLNRTVTSGGSDVLASELSALSCQDIAARQQALSELAGRESLRTDYLSYGQQSVIDTQEVLSALHAMKKVRLPGWSRSVVALVVAVAAVVGVVLSVVLAVAGVVPADVPVTWLVTQFVLVYALHMRALRVASKAVNKMHQQLKTYISLIVLIVESGLQSRELRDIVGLLSDNSLKSFQELQAILDGLDRRGNQLGLFLSDAFACSDFFLVRRFQRWQDRYLLQVETWIDAVNRFDALVSMATFCSNEPSAVDAEVLGTTDEVVYEAEALRHPFLGEKVVNNDFRLADGHYYIVTGANMAGKSTFLRTVGVNYVLARCGMPVFARRFRVSHFSLFSSMRTTDDLTQGISYFNAELLRLQQLMGYARKQQRTLIILDEILKGTNSLDKLNGSRLFLEHIRQQPVTGIIATHDLELSRMADEHPDRFHNYCFEIELSDRVTYTYQITPGVARNQNATYLLKRIVLGEGA